MRLKRLKPPDKRGRTILAIADDIHTDADLMAFAVTVSHDAREEFAREIVPLLRFKPSPTTIKAVSDERSYIP